jgi:hypothetical protein
MHASEFAIAAGETRRSEAENRPREYMRARGYRSAKQEKHEKVRRVYREIAHKKFTTQRHGTH